ncbi:MAG: hypothetical protein KKB30_13515 [Proteobacteria bacterium]|nr:hypothetical protein [Pseudomonadota bacterium]MBU1717368.1 hypothetical protein [Pseudomonadota bacterium]
MLKNLFLVIILLFGVIFFACSSGGGSDPVVEDNPTDNPVDDTIPAVSSKPESLPTFNSVSLYSATSPFNQKIATNPEIDPNSAILVQSLIDSEYFILQVKEFASPVYFADADTPRKDVELFCGPEWGLGISTMKNVPIPDWAEPSDDSGGSDLTVIGCGGGADQDNHMVILNLADRCEYTFWQARTSQGQWQSSWASGISMDSTGIFPNGMSTRGSGFSFTGGVIWPDELAQGRIDHVLAMAYPYTKAGGPVAPATDSDGITVSNTAIPEGAIIQLDPAFDLTPLSLTSYEMVIAKAMQEYGMLIVDTNGDSGISFYAIDPRSVVNNPYESLLPDDSYVVLENFDLATLPLRVLKLPPQDVDWEESLMPVNNACATIE